MPLPTFAEGRSIHYDTPLSNFAVAAFMDASDPGNKGLIGEQLYPAFTVAKESDLYYIIQPDKFLRNPGNTTLLRARGTEAKKVEWTISSDSYKVKNYAEATAIPLEDLDNADQAVMLRENSTRMLVSEIKIAQEVRIANNVTSISNVGSGVVLSGATKWSDYANSDPVAAVNTGHAFIRRNTGIIANTMVMDYDTFMVVRRHPALLDMYKYTQGGQLTEEVLASAFGVEKLLIGQGVMNVTAEGATASFSNIWGNNAVLAYVNPSVGPRTATLGMRFQWQPPIFPANFGVQTNVFDKAGEKKVEVLEVGHFQDEKIIARNLGYTFNTTI